MAYSKTPYSSVAYTELGLLPGDPEVRPSIRFALGCLNGAGDDPPWSSFPMVLRQNQNLYLPQKTVMRPAFMVPRPYDEPTWQGPPENYNATLAILLPHTTQNPFKIPVWKFSYADDQNVWYSQPANNNLSTINSAQSVGEKGGFFNAPDDHPGWQKYSVGVFTGSFPAGQNPSSKQKFWRYDSSMADDCWQPTNDMLSSAFSTLLSKLTITYTVLPSFTVPNPDDSSYWQFSNSMSSAAFETLLNAPAAATYLPGRSVIVPRGLEDNIWQFSPAMSSATSATLLNAVTLVYILRPGFYAPRGIEDPLWQAPIDMISASPTIRIPPVTTHNPFQIPTWKFSYTDDQNVWYSQPSNNNLSAIGTLSSNTAREGIFVNVPDDQPFWQISIDMSSAGPTIRIPTATQTPAKPAPWKFSYIDDQNVWYSQPANNNLSGLSSLQFVIEKGGLFNTPNDEPGWQNYSVSIPASYFPAPQSPSSKQKFWRYDYDMSLDGLWQQYSVAIPISYIKLVNKLASPQKFWRYDYDVGESFWQGSPKASLNTNLLIGPNAFIPPPWKFSYADDQNVWNAKPTAGVILVPILATAGQPPTKRWFSVYTYDVGESFWQGAPSASLNTDLLIGPNTFIAPPWKFSYADDQNVWNAKPVAGILQVPILSTAGQPPTKRWSLIYNYDVGESFWQGAPKATINTNLLIGPNAFIAPPWKFHHDEAPPWQPILSRQMELLVLPPPQIRVIPGVWRYNPDDPPCWFFNYRPIFPSSVLAPLIVDYRYVVSPNAPLPSNRGAGRKFVVTPKVKFRAF